MYENNDIFIGWSYVKALFDCLQEMSEKVKTDQLITPRYIFRGITQRHFTSSASISRYLNENPMEINRLLGRNTDNEKFKYKDRCKAEKRFYQEKHDQMLRLVGGKAYHDKGKALELLREIVGLTNLEKNEKNEIFDLIKSRYIRSGAAVRLFHQLNRTQYDYVAYLKNLIIETKSRYPVEYRGFSDLELLAELQHKGAATCLVDFSTNFLNALWFATQDYTNPEPQIGYVFCYDTNTDAIERNNLVFLNKDKERRSIEQLISRTSYTLDFHGNRLCRFLLWKPSNINSRIARQDSIFVFGIEKFDISEHPIFILPIPPHWKEPIQRVLKDFFGLTAETLYADIAGVATSNGKRDPLRTQTKYFNEDILKPEGTFNLGFDSLDIFQKGTSALLKAQYEIALEYFCSFEGSNFVRITRQIEREHYSDRYRILSMLLTELHFSKGICLRHLKKYQDARRSYDKSIETCLDILQHYKDEELPCITGNYLSYRTNLHHYVFDKLFKIIEDYIDFLFDIHDYHGVYVSLRDFLQNYQENYGTPPYEMRMLISTVCNEAKILSDLWSKQTDSYLEFISCPSTEPSGLNPLCGILNKLYHMIEHIIATPLEKVAQYNIDAAEELHKDIEEAIQQQQMPRNGKYNKDIFVGWLLDDVKDVISTKLEEHPNKRNAILGLVAIVEDCRRQIEGRKRYETY